jgi:hypothetical protein
MPDSLEKDTPAFATPRRHPRFEADVRVCLLRTDGSGRSYSGRCVNVAIGGIGAQVHADFEVGEEVEVQFPDSASPSQLARVVYRSNNEYGLSFIEVVGLRLPL